MQKVALAAMLALAVAFATPCASLAFCSSTPGGHRCGCCGEQPGPCCSAEQSAPATPTTPAPLAPPEVAVPVSVGVAEAPTGAGVWRPALLSEVRPTEPADAFLLHHAFRC